MIGQEEGGIRKDESIGWRKTVRNEPLVIRAVLALA